MTNIHLRTIEEYLDVASVYFYNTFHKRDSEENRMRRVYRASRDSARTSMQWNKGKHAGFSTVVPWFTLNPNYRKINAAEEEKDPDSILHFYRKCIALRKQNETLLFGSYRE